MAVKMKNRMASPPNGWQFTIPQIGVKNNQSWSFDEMVNKYLAIAQANPKLKLPTDRKQVGDLLDTQNAMRILQIKGADIYVTFSGSAPPPKMILPRSLAASVDAGTNLASGLELLTDWLGSGKKPVKKEQAESRAQTCTGCPMNKPGDWKAIFTNPASAAIRKMLSMKHDLKLETSVDDKLEICEACLCPLRLKVWCDISLIRSHTSQDQLAQFHEGCWIKKELAQ